VNAAVVTHIVALDQPDPAEAIRAFCPAGVQRVIDVALSDNIDLNVAITANQAVIAAYATRRDRPDFRFWPMLFNNITIRLLGSDDFPTDAKQHAATDLTNARTTARCPYRSRHRYPCTRRCRPTTALTPAPANPSCWPARPEAPLHARTPMITPTGSANQGLRVDLGAAPRRIETAPLEVSADTMARPGSVCRNRPMPAGRSWPSSDTPNSS
jgi:hypothetical protein